MIVSVTRLFSHRNQQQEEIVQELSKGKWFDVRDFTLNKPHLFYNTGIYLCFLDKGTIFNVKIIKNSKNKLT